VILDSILRDLEEMIIYFLSSYPIYPDYPVKNKNYRIIRIDRIRR